MKSNSSKNLNQILAKYLQAVVGCAAPDRDQPIQQYPDLADGLREFFANQDQIELDSLRGSVVSKPPGKFAADTTATYSSGALSDSENPEVVYATEDSVIPTAAQYADAATKQRTDGVIATIHRIERFL